MPTSTASPIGVCGCTDDAHCAKAETLFLLWQAFEGISVTVDTDMSRMHWRRAMRLYWWHRHPHITDPTTEWNINESEKGADGAYITHKLGGNPF